MKSNDTSAFQTKPSGLPCRATTADERNVASRGFGVLDCLKGGRAGEARWNTALARPDGLVFIGYARDS
jgi:hypothetical protein